MKTFIITAMVFYTAGNLVYAQSNGDIKMEQRLTLITLGVSDLERSTVFYEDKFGWEIAFNPYLELDEKGKIKQD